MEIYLDKLAVRQIRIAAADAIEEGDMSTLCKGIIEAFAEEHVEEIDRRLVAADFRDLLTEIIEEWGGDEVDELLELLETQLAEHAIDLKYYSPDDDLDDGDDDEEEEEDFDGEIETGDDEI